MRIGQRQAYLIDGIEVEVEKTVDSIGFDAWQPSIRHGFDGQTWEIAETLPKEATEHDAIRALQSRVAEIITERGRVAA